MNGLRKYSFYFLAGIAILLFALSSLSLFYDESSTWWIKILNFPRTQAFIASVAVLALVLLFVKKISVANVLLLISLLVAIGINASFIVAYTPLTAKEVSSLNVTDADPKHDVSILIANVYLKNHNASTFINEVLEKDPDIVLAMETNKWWQRALQPLRAKYAYHIEYPLEDTYGMMVYSRFKLQNPKILFLEHARVPSIHTQVQLLNGRWFFFHGVHPVPPLPSKKYPDNMGEDAGELKKVAALVAGEKGPVVVAGDFNDVAWSNSNRVFRKNSRLNDVRAGRGLYNTFNAHSFIMRWPLDHVFVTKDFKLIALERLGKFGSDHFPFYVQLALLP